MQNILVPYKLSADVRYLIVNAHFPYFSLLHLPSSNDRLKLIFKNTNLVTLVNENVINILFSY